MQLANEESYPAVHRKVLRGHIAQITKDADIPLRSLERGIPGSVFLFLAGITALLGYQIF